MIICTAENRIKYSLQEPRTCSEDELVKIILGEEKGDLTIEKNNHVFHGAFEYYLTKDSEKTEKPTEPGGRIVYQHEGKTYKSHPIIKIEKTEDKG